MIQTIIEKVLRAMFGYMLYGLGISMTVNANQGLAPWGVFHDGLAGNLGILFGTASQLVGAAIVILDIFLGERIGWGTVGNVFFIGYFINLVDKLDFIPKFNNIFLSYLLMFAGMATISLATYFYLSAQLGAGPRDGLMIALTKRSKFSVGTIRNIIEFCVVIAGYLLGGKIGIGTLIMAFFMGRFIQLCFRLFKFDVRVIKHRYVDEDLKSLFEKLKNC